MHSGEKAVLWFNEITKNDIPIVGGKGANLGEMTNAGIPVPTGFVVTATAYFDFLKQTGITDKIRQLLKPLDVNDSRQLQQTAEKVREVIIKAAMSPELAAEIK